VPECDALLIPNSAAACIRVMSADYERGWFGSTGVDADVANSSLVDKQLATVILTIARVHSGHAARPQIDL
jgi:hypothetical protein